MGSLTSGPKAPTPQPQVVYLPQTPSPTTPVQTPTAPSAQETSAEIRKQNLLGRERSRFGTIQTSFRGLLGLSDTGGAQSRKTLLGE
ncbi:MAG: hypothetical protein GW778_04630 [Alphaproteobacteria bacterium]|nr:hypothetical protein [Alphaproteobacteria bacterium]